MYSFPQFTRSTLWGEFAWEGTIIFEDFMVRGQFLEGGQFSSRAVVQGEIIRRQSSRWQLFWGLFSSEKIVLEPCKHTELILNFIQK